VISAIIQAILAALSVFKQERAIHNSPELIKNKLDIARQQARDALRNAESLLADTDATSEQHAEALRQLRLAGS
jgi:hypothetical protein